MKLVDRGISRAKVDESERGIKEWEGRISLVTLLCPRDEKERECFLPVSSVFDTARNSRHESSQGRRRYGKGILAADERGGKNEGEASDRLSFRRLLNELLSHHGRQVPSLSTGVDSLY